MPEHGHFSREATSYFEYLNPVLLYAFGTCVALALVLAGDDPKLSGMRLSLATCL